MVIYFYKKSLKGNYRIIQQDRILVTLNKEGFYLFAICDGMGGQSHGEVASKIASRTLKNDFRKSFFKGLNDNDICDWIKLIFRNISNKMYFYEQHDAELKGMGTTCVLGILINDKFYVANSGDSRCYLLDYDFPEKLKQITVDHNIKNNIDEFQKTNIFHVLHDKENYNYTFWKMLTSSLTANVGAKIGFYTLKVKPGYYFLTSDGLHDYISSHDMKNILMDKKLSLKAQGKAFFVKAKQGMSNDNMSLILIKIK